MNPRVSIVTTHFYDFEWTSLLVKRVLETIPAEQLREFVVIDQDRTNDSRAKLQSLSPKLRICQYPRDEAFFKKMGHDHPAVLDLTVRQLQGDYGIILDSDSHPISADWIDRIHRNLDGVDCLLAEDTLHPGQSHPCFMVFKRECLQSICFSDGILSHDHDTGRRVVHQMLASGKRFSLLGGQPAFNGAWGRIYCDAVYHHGSGSFAGASDPRMRSHEKIQRRKGAHYFRSQVLNRGRYTLPLGQRLWRAALRTVRSG